MALQLLIESTEISVTKFGKKYSLRRNYKSLVISLGIIYYLVTKIETNLLWQKSLCHFEKFQCFKWPNIEKSERHLVTMNGTMKNIV